MFRGNGIVDADMIPFDISKAPFIKTEAVFFKILNSEMIDDIMKNTEMYPHILIILMHESFMLWQSIAENDLS